jgi:hypothetical protein
MYIYVHLNVILHGILCACRTCKGRETRVHWRLEPEEMTALGTRSGKSKDEMKKSYKPYDNMWTAFIFPEAD